MKFCGMIFGWVMVAAASTAWAQAADWNAGPAGLKVREIADPALRAVWVLKADPQHPGGPGRLVRRDAAGSAAKAADGRTGPLVIRAGDRIEVEEHTAVADVTLEAVATVPAREGAQFTVRLKAGGRILRVWAVAPGRALIAGPVEVGP
jgi:hypothetical protein